LNQKVTFRGSIMWKYIQN